MIDLSAPGWFGWAVVSMLCFGVQSLLYKRLTALGGDVLTAQIIMPAVVCVGSLLVITARPGPWADDLLILTAFALLQGAFFYWTTWYRLDALKHGMPTNVLFPILKTSTVMVVLVSIPLLDEWNSLTDPARLTGIICSIAATYLILRRPSGDHAWRIGLLSALVAVIASAGASLMAKGAIHQDPSINVFVFILISNLVTLLLAAAQKLRNKERASDGSHGIGLRGGALIGLLNFGGIASFMLALEDGDLSVVASISALYIMIPIVFASWAYGERLTIRIHLAIAVTVAAMVLLSL